MVNSVNSKSASGWNNNVEIYTSAQKDQDSYIGSNWPVANSIFTDALLSKMDYTLDSKQVRSLYEADKNVGKSLTDGIGGIGIDTENPAHSANAEADGWVSKQQDPNRKSKAIIIEGNMGDDKTSTKDGDDMKKKLEEDYGLSDSDITVLSGTQANEAGLENAMKDIQNPGNSDSQVLLYYSGHGKNNIISPQGEKDDNTVINKATMQRLVNKYFSNYKHANVILDACDSGSFL